MWWVNFRENVKQNEVDVFFYVVRVWLICEKQRKLTSTAHLPPASYLLHCLRKLEYIHHFRSIIEKIFFHLLLAAHSEHKIDPFELQRRCSVKWKKTKTWCCKGANRPRKWVNLFHLNWLFIFYLQENLGKALWQPMTASRSCHRLQGLLSFRWGSRPCWFLQEDS